MNRQPDIKLSALLAYSALALPLAFAGMPLYLYAPDFYAMEYGVSLAVIGTILLFIRSIDAIQDPVIGWLSDRYASWRIMIMSFGVLLMGISFYMLFHPLETQILLWFAMSMFLLTTAFSILSINFNTLGGIWTQSTHDKTRITSSREAFGLVGVLLAAILPAVLMETQSTTQAFHNVSLVFIGLVLMCSLIFMSWLFYFDEPRQETQKASWRISVLWQEKSKALRRFYLVYFVSMLASAIPVVMVIFFVRDHLNAEAYLGMFLGVYFLSGIAGMPIWQWIARRKGKLYSWACAMVLAMSAFVWAYFLQAGDILQYVLICIGSGLALGAELALPPSVLSDLIDENEALESASIQFSVQNFLAKLSLAVATGIILPILSLFGFQPGQEMAAGSNILQFAYAAIPCGVKAIALVLIVRWHKQQGANNENNQHLYSGGHAHVSG